MEILLQPLNLSKKEDKEILVEELIREEVLKIQGQMKNATPEQRVGLRENLGRIVAEYGGDGTQRMIRDKSSQQDSQEFLTPLFGGLFGNQQFKVSSSLKEKVNTDQFKPVDPKIEPLAIIPLPFPDNEKGEASFNQMINHFQAPEILEGNNKFEFEKKNGGKEKKEAIKQMHIDIPENKNRNELIFSVKRFHQDDYGNRSKITRDVNFNNYNFNEKIYEPTAFVLHGGSLSGGHYTAYIKENDDKWYCYNDSGRSEVSGKTLEDAKKQAYLVKYSAQGTALPDSQHGTQNFYGGYGNRCWLNASLAFATSFTTVSKDNFRSSPEQRQKLREEILGKKEEKKEPQSKEVIKNSNLEKPNNIPTNLIDPERRFIEKIIADPTLRTTFLGHLKSNTNFLENIDKKDHAFNLAYDEYQECLKNIPTTGFDLTHDLTREFTQQYLGFLLDEYDKFGADLSDAKSIINNLDLKNKPKLAESFNQIEFSIQERSFDFLKGQGSNLKNLNDKNLNSFKKKLSDFLAVVNDRNLGKDNTNLKEEINTLQKEVFAFENDKTKEKKEPEEKNKDVKKQNDNNPTKPAKTEQKDDSSNKFKDAGINKFKITAPNESNRLGDAASNSTSKLSPVKVDGKAPRVLYKGEIVNPAQEFEDVKRKVQILYPNPRDEKNITINKIINEKIKDIDLKDPNLAFNDKAQEAVAWIHAMNNNLEKAIKAKYAGDNLRRELKEAKTAEDNPAFLRLNTLQKNLRMNVPESVLSATDVNQAGILSLLTNIPKSTFPSITGGSEEEREWLEKNTIHRMITKPIPGREKRLIQDMIKLSDSEKDYYDASIDNLIENDLVLEEKSFKLNKNAILAKELTHLAGDTLNWLGQGIFAPETRPEETSTWKKHVDRRNHYLQNFYRHLNPDRDGAFNIKYKELYDELEKLSVPDKLMTAEEFQKIMNLISKYAQEQETEKFRNLGELEKQLTDANQKILAKAEEIGIKEDELWKYKMLQMMIAFSPLAPLNILNHIGDILAPIQHFLDMCGIDTVIDWISHDSPLKYIIEPFTETFDFASNLVSPITSSASSLLESPITGIAIDALATLVLADKWSELNVLKNKADEESKQLNKNIKKASEAVQEYENAKITACAKEILPIWGNKYKKLAVYDKLCEKNYAELEELAKVNKKLDEFKNTDEFKKLDINDDGSKEDSIRKKTLAAFIARDLTGQAIKNIYGSNNEQAERDGYFKMARDYKIPYYNFPQILKDKIRNKEIRKDDFDYWLVKEDCAKNGINFDAAYRPKSSITDVTESDSNDHSLKPVPNLSKDEKAAIEKKARELEEQYRKQEDKDIENIKNRILKSIENGFDRSGASRDSFESLVKITDDHGIPSPIPERRCGEPFITPKMHLLGSSIA